MTPEIRRAAIRAAAKAALVTAIGCGGGADPKTSTTPSNVSATPADKPAAQVECASFLGGLAKVKQADLPDDDPLKKSMGVYGMVFSDRKARESADTQKCCAEELDRSGASSKFRWECCSAVPNGNGVACTPWGPPCPPAMPA